MAAKFFALSAEEKMSIHHSSSPAFRGYIAHAAENTGGLADLREQVTHDSQSTPGKPFISASHVAIKSVFLCFAQ
jgi:isopenicillin N synthase-like dioxygenase